MTVAYGDLGVHEAWGRQWGGGVEQEMKLEAGMSHEGFKERSDVTKTCVLKSVSCEE